MTRAEAIKYLEVMATDMVGCLAGAPDDNFAKSIQKRIDAIDMAITALQENEELRNSYDQLQAICDTMYASNNAMGAALCEQEQREWISVEERLPKLHTKVLVYRGNLGGMGGYVSIDHMDVRWVDDEPMWAGDALTWKSKVTHWMPLPSSPEEVKE